MKSKLKITQKYLNHQSLKNKFLKAIKFLIDSLLIKLPNPIHLPANAEIDSNAKKNFKVIRISRMTAVSNNLPARLAGTWNIYAFA